MDYVIYHHTSELGPKQFTLEKLPTDLKNININIRYSPEVDSLLDVLYKIKHSDTQVSDMAMEKDSILAIEQTLEHNPKSITNLYNIKGNIIYHSNNDDYFGCHNAKETEQNNIYGKLLMKIRDKHIYYSARTPEQIICELLEKLNNAINCYSSMAIIGGSWGLKQMEIKLKREKSWVPDDIDIYITNHISWAKTQNIIRFVFKDYHVISGNYKCIQLLMPVYNIKIQLVRMTNLFNCVSDYSIDQLDSAIDISITKCFMVYEYEESSCVDPVYHDSYKIQKFEGTKITLMAKHSVVEDIIHNRCSFYGNESYDEASMYAYRQKRLEKYFNRGYINVIHEPRELTPILNNYMESVILW